MTLSPGSPPAPKYGPFGRVAALRDLRRDSGVAPMLVQSTEKRANRPYRPAEDARCAYFISGRSQGKVEGDSATTPRDPAPLQIHRHWHPATEGSNFGSTTPAPIFSWRILCPQDYCFGAKYFEQLGPPGIVFSLGVAMITLITPVLALVSSSVTFGTGALHQLGGRPLFGWVLLMPRIDIHILPSRVVYRVSHERSGPGGRRKTGNDLAGRL
jgi:hypothetical protein